MADDPDFDEYVDPGEESASTIRIAANVLGVIAGVLFFVAAWIHLDRQNELNVYFLAMGVLFLFFPFLMNRVVRSD